MFHPFFDLGRKLLHELAADHFNELSRFVVQMTVRVARLNPVEITGDGADVLRDRPFVIVQDNNEAFGMVGNVIECFITSAASKGSIASYHHDILFAAAPVASDRHTQPGRQRGTRMASTVTVVFALCTEKKAV